MAYFAIFRGPNSKIEPFMGRMSLHGVRYACCTLPPILIAQRTFCPPFA